MNKQEQPYKKKTLLQFCLCPKLLVWGGGDGGKVTGHTGGMCAWQMMSAWIIVGGGRVGEGTFKGAMLSFFTNKLI